MKLGQVKRAEHLKPFAVFLFQKKTNCYTGFCLYQCDFVKKSILLIYFCICFETPFQIDWPDCSHQMLVSFIYIVLINVQLSMMTNTLNSELLDRWVWTLVSPFIDMINEFVLSMTRYSFHCCPSVPVKFPIMTKPLGN